jgi:DNA replicative helicase MCM subunit Mcm2 (Cdc46/Mcm family)
MYPYYHSLYTDLVFILLDKPDESHDRMISEHIMRTHALAGNKTSKRREDKGGADGTGTGTRGSQGPTPPVEEEEIGQSTLSQRLRRFAGLYEDGSNSDIHQSRGDDGTLRFVYSVTCRTYISTAIQPPDLLQLMLLSCYSYPSMSYTTHSTAERVAVY